MERYIGVSQARAWFADVLNTSAYASDRVVIRRRGQELGAFVGVADLDYLRRNRPESRFPEPKKKPLPASPLEIDLEWREALLESKERHLREAGGDPATDPELAEERELLERLREYVGPPRSSA